MKEIKRYVNDLRALGAWLKNSDKGDRMIYHTGLLMKDRIISQDGRTMENSALDKMARDIWNAYEMGDVKLVQKKSCEGIYDYIAIRN